jgi:predicted RNA-binding protein YlxR (DUF448 family)
MNKLSFSQIIRLMNGKGANVSVDFQLPDDHRTVWIICHSAHNLEITNLSFIAQYERNFIALI